MSEQEKLKEKLSTFFEEKLSSLHKKLTNDIEEIEKLKYEFVDDCIKNLDKELKEREIILEEHEKKHEKHHSDIKEKKHNENKEKKNEKEHKEDHKEEHKVEHKVEKEFVKKHPNKRISVDETRSKTPLKELKQKNRILKLDKSADRIPVKNKDKEKNKNNPIKVLKQSATLANTIQREHKDREYTPTGKNQYKKGNRGKDTKKNIGQNTKNKKEGKVKDKNDKNLS